MSYRVCVFCGSRPGGSAAYVSAARALGRGVAERGWTLVYGGGDVGLMGISADAALGGGGAVTGIIPQRLLEREVGKIEVTDLQVTSTMYERKERMIDGSDAFVVLPGGLGTLDELLEVMTLRQLGYHDKPIVLVDVDGYWQPCLRLFEAVVEGAFADASVLDLYAVAPTAEAALDLLGP